VLPIYVNTEAMYVLSEVGIQLLKKYSTYVHKRQALYLCVVRFYMSLVGFNTIYTCNNILVLYRRTDIQ
jgi:hypothetical protein